ncbi:dihydroxyacetone kinase subunit DhaL [Salibacterium qingdaonense]|uniref:phosphoenolpyruvate--glycerone phosphotransferase n=1 Tax=Salibacterium qingdaonense TaxID=266892 RepID=A0A1I4P1D7_9BACI|nr:dihydroxyacetone kinase subunit DhaL [Salibacterium qingdaonense]SFM21485.1 dihydroxyacetone kinase DhaL subunit [Salibacterium qingdaonense]
MEKQTMNHLSVDDVKQMLLYVGETITASKDYLGQIDAEIGDGDHGTGMATGAEAFMKKLRESEFETINDVFKTTGMEMMKSMGGASGIIFGTMFSDGVKQLESKSSIDHTGLADIFRGSLDSVKKRGKADVGDKTMIDALDPAVQTLESDASKEWTLTEVLKHAEEAAWNGVEETKQITAKHGRAKTLGERTKGYQDAGATSVWLIFKSMREWVEQHEG